MSPVRNALGFSLALAALAVSIPVGRADSLPPLAQSTDPQASEAARDAMTAAERQFAEAETRKIRQCLKMYEAYKPGPTPAWARELGPGSVGDVPSINVTRQSESVDPAGVGPTELRDRLHALAFTGRLDIGVYNLFAANIAAIRLGTHARPKQSSESRIPVIFTRSRRYLIQPDVLASFVTQTPYCSEERTVNPLPLLGIVNSVNVQGVVTQLDGKLRKSFSYGSAVQIESGLYLTAMHLFTGPFSAGPDSYKQIPIDFRIGASALNDGDPPRREISGGTQLNIGSISNLSNFSVPIVNGRFDETPRADLAAIRGAPAPGGNANVSGFTVIYGL